MKCQHCMKQEAMVNGMFCFTCLPLVMKARDIEHQADEFAQDPKLLKAENSQLQGEIERLRRELNQNAMLTAAQAKHLRKLEEQGLAPQTPIRPMNTSPDQGTANHRSLKRQALVDNNPTEIMDGPPAAAVEDAIRAIPDAPEADPLDAFQAAFREISEMAPIRPTSVELTERTRVTQKAKRKFDASFFRQPAVVGVMAIFVMALTVSGAGKLFAAKKQNPVLATIEQQRAAEPSAFVTKEKKLVMRLEPGQAAPQTVAAVQKDVKPATTTRQPEVRKPKPEPTPARVEPTAEEKEQDEKVSAVIAQAATIEIDAKIEEMRDKYDGALLDLKAYSFASELCNEELVKDHVNLFQFLAKKLPLVQHTERAREITQQAERLGRTIADLKAEKRCGESLPVDSAGRNSVLAMNSEIRRRM